MSMIVDGPTEAVLDEVRIERENQDAKWGADSDHPDGTARAGDLAMLGAAVKATVDAAHANRVVPGTLTWRHILDEEVREAFCERDPTGLRTELIQVAAVAVAWVEAIDRREVSGV